MANLQQKARSAAQVHKNRKCLGWTAKGETGRCCLEVTNGEDQGIRIRSKRRRYRSNWRVRVQYTAASARRKGRHRK